MKPNNPLGKPLKIKETNSFEQCGWCVAMIFGLIIIGAIFGVIVL